MAAPLNDERSLFTLVGELPDGERSAGAGWGDSGAGAGSGGAGLVFSPAGLGGSGGGLCGKATQLPFTQGVQSVSLGRFQKDCSACRRMRSFVSWF